MRLIDADKLMLSLADWELQEAPIHTYEKPKEFTADDMQRMIWRTIRDCESAVEEQPTVKAIPIEWIEKWGRRNTWYYGNKDNVITMLLRDWNCKQRVKQANKILEDWEKENETN